MERKFFDEVVIDNYEGNNCKIVLTYYLLTSAVSEEYSDLMVYGVEIDKLTLLAGGKREKERKIIRDLFFKKEEAKKFLSMITENTVTPMGLKYVVNDYIDEKILAGEGDVIKK